MRPEKSAEAIVVGGTRRRAEPDEARELKSLALLGQKPCKRALVEGEGRKPERSTEVPIGSQGSDRTWDSTEPPDTWTVCPVVREDGGGAIPHLLPDQRRSFRRLYERHIS